MTTSARGWLHRRHRALGVMAAVVLLAAAFVVHAGYWVAPLTFAPLYLTYRTYKVYMGRIQDQQRHVAQVSDLHLATIEALALAIDAKDQTAQSHIRRVQVYAAGLERLEGAERIVRPHHPHDLHRVQDDSGGAEEHRRPARRIRGLAERRVHRVERDRAHHEQTHVTSDPGR